MIFPHHIERKIFDATEDSKLLFLPKDPSLFKIRPIIEDILSFGERLDQKTLIDKLSISYPKDVIIDALEELQILEKRGFFCLLDTYPYRKGLKAKDIFCHRPSILELHLTHSCNMACTYCYAKGGDYGLYSKNNDHNKKTMSWWTAKKAIDWFLTLNENHKQRLVIEFYGGEPLLNVEVMERVLDYIYTKQKSGNCSKVIFSLCTNGTLLKNDRIINLIVDYGVRIVISFNTIKKTHNNYRIYKDGFPTFEDIAEGIAKINKIAPKFPISIFSTIGLDDDVQGIYKNSASLRITSTDIGFEHLSFTNTLLLDDKAKIHDALKRIKLEFDREYKNAIATNQFVPGSIGYTDLLLFIKGGMRFMGTCGAGVNKVSILPRGEISMCSGIRLGISNSVFLGSIKEGISEKNWDKVFDISTQTPCVQIGSVCYSCWARSYCSKLCPFSKSEPQIKEGENGYCDLHRLRIQFKLKMFSLMEREDALFVMGDTEVPKDTAKAGDFREKIELLFKLRQLYNQPMKYIHQITPVLI